MNSAKRVRLIKGSHIVVPAALSGRAPLHPAERRQADRVRDPVRGRVQPDRHHRRALRGRSRPRPRSRPTRPTICAAWSTATSSARSRPADVVWSYAGVRPLYDDASGNASAVTRDYVFDLDAGAGRAPLLSIFGGKITTYRKLAEHALEKLQPVMGFTQRRLDRRRRPARRRHAGCRLRARSWRRRGASIRGCPRRLLRRWARAYGTRLRSDRRRRQRRGRPRPRSRRRPVRGRGRYLVGARVGARRPTTCSGGARGSGLHVGRRHGGPARRSCWRERRPGTVAAARPMSLRLEARSAASSATRSGSTRCRSTCRPGQLYVLLGPTLAGKTSLMRLMAGLDRPSAGPHPGRRRRRDRHVRAQAQRRHGLPAVHQLPDAHRLRQHRLALAAAGRSPRPRSTGRCATPRACCTSTTCSTGCRPSCRAASSSASRSPARWSSSAHAAAARRAAGQPRLQAARGAARRAARPVRPPADDRGLRHHRAARGADHGRRGDRHGRGPRPAAAGRPSRSTTARARCGSPPSSATRR